MQNDRISRVAIRPRLAALAVCLCAVGALLAKDDPGKGLRFSSPQVLDLAESTQKFDGAVVPVNVLAATEAAKVLAAASLTEDQSSLPFSDDLYGCKTPSTACSQQHERKLIDAAGGALKRDGKHLTIAQKNGAPLVFVDWTDPQNKNADGDSETHWYLGRLTGSGYHRVEVQFGQDAPGSFLINPASGKIAFVHNGSDIVAASPDGMHLVTFNRDNPPLSIRVAALDAIGPRLQLRCDVGKDADKVGGEFKGWHDAHSFDITLKISAEHSKPERQIALRATQGASGWSIATADKPQLAAIGMVCKEVK
ncbi:MAG TPA: hypothetical protein VK660_06630 [Xanthomonadaceae bacterium]|jgi:hypothetical protein|nr:hypothetical protein [Xanthomonadaceae bacterium]